MQNEQAWAFTQEFSKMFLSIESSPNSKTIKLKLEEKYPKLVRNQKEATTMLNIIQNQHKRFCQDQEDDESYAFRAYALSLTINELAENGKLLSTKNLEELLPQVEKRLEKLLSRKNSTRTEKEENL